MNTSRLETLLEKLVEQNEEIISVLSDLRETAQYHFESLQLQQTEMVHALNDMKDELDWSGDLSLGKQLMNRLDDINEELNWVGQNTLGRMLYDGLNAIEQAVSNVETAVQVNG